MRPDSPTPQDHGLGVGGSVVGVAGGAGSDIGGSIAAGQFAGFAADGVAPEAGAVGALYLHDIAVTACGENALLVAGLHAFDFAAQLAILFFEDQNARDTGKVDALILAQALSSGQAGNVAQAVAACAAIGALRTNQTEAVVLTESLGVNVGQLGGLADGEDGQFDVEATSSAPSRSALPITSAVAHIAYNCFIWLANRAIVHLLITG